MKAAKRQIWARPASIVCMALCSMGATNLSSAQDGALDDMQRNIEIFSGVLREGLG